MLYGAIIGDIAGSRFEKKKAPEYNFNIFTKKNQYLIKIIYTYCIFYFFLLYFYQKLVL